MKVGIVSFPGSIGTTDTERAFQDLLGAETAVLTHQTEVIRGYDLLVIPGGFSFGDHLRPGAMAKLTSIAAPIRRWARTNRILGIGNGFQILCELGVLPGVFLPNPGLRFAAENVYLRFEGGKSFLGDRFQPGDILKLPLACYYGRYFVSGKGRRDINEQKLAVFRYCAEDGTVDEEFFANQSTDGIAALSNAEGNVLGIMARPERAVEEMFGNTDGLKFLRAIAQG